MSAQSLVSVIIPFLDPGPWLAEAIESVMLQTYSSWEIILVDDGSKEADRQQAKEYCRLLPEKILYYSHEGNINKGLTASRNLGVRKARGKFIALLDADDCWQTFKLEKQLDLFRLHPDIAMICEASVFWYNWSGAGKENYIQQIGASPGIYLPYQLISILYPFGQGQPPCPSGILIKRDALQRNGGFEESFSGVFQLYEDQAFLFKMYCHEIIFISAEANNFYRKRENSMSSAAGNTDIYKTVRQFFSKWVQDYISGLPNYDPAIDLLLQHFKK